MATSLLRNAYDRFMASRERQVGRYVNGALMSLDDKTLASLGTSREELRRKGGKNFAF
ncbi:hypothetical protein M8R20_16345 [Pseudomonas sp. R2.Fl]|nr:hypothetical protein [Pseudomonas sp. R2.Fl]